VPAFEKQEVPVTRACALLGVSRRRLKYVSKKDDSELVDRMMELASRHSRWGSRQLARALRRRGEVVNLKRVRRLCRLHGLLLKQRRRKKRLGIGAGMPCRAEYPNHVSHTLRADDDALPPHVLYPAFYGCFDWHSDVHGHWLLVRLLRLYPDARFAAEARSELNRSFTAQNMAGELRYLQGQGRASFERPYGLAWLLLLPLLSSAYGFSQVHAKTDDGFFLGFPSYWNIVAFYLYVLHVPAWVSVTLIVTCVILTFVPTPYLYATRGGPFARLINVGAAIWFVLLGWVLLGGAGDSRTLAVLSLIYPSMYLALSAAVTVRARAPSPPRVDLLVLFLLAAITAGGCLVVSLQPAYDAESVVFDEALVGVWEDTADGYKATIERGEWRSYKVTFTDRFSTRSFQGNLTKLGGTSFLDVTEMRGTDLGPYLVPVHGIVRLTLARDTLTAALLDYDWLTRAMTARSLGRPAAAMDDRRNAVVTAPTSELRRWLLRAPADAFEAPSTFTRKD